MVALSLLQLKIKTLYELEIYDLIVAKVEFKIYRYRYRYRGKSLFTYRLLTELKIPLPYISDFRSRHDQAKGREIRVWEIIN